MLRNYRRIEDRASLRDVLTRPPFGGQLLFLAARATHYAVLGKQYFQDIIQEVVDTPCELSEEGSCHPKRSKLKDTSAASFEDVNRVVIDGSLRVLDRGRLTGQNR